MPRDTWFATLSSKIEEVKNSPRSWYFLGAGTALIGSGAYGKYGWGNQNELINSLRSEINELKASKQFCETDRIKCVAELDELKSIGTIVTMNGTDDGSQNTCPASDVFSRQIEELKKMLECSDEK